MTIRYTWLNWLLISGHITDEKKLGVIKANDEIWKLTPRDFENKIYLMSEKNFGKYMGHEKFRKYINKQLDIFINTGEIK